jgi:hypothetical protein
MFDAALAKGSGWKVVHEALTRLARARAGLDFDEGRKLRAAQRARVHERLGYGSFVEYIRLFGYSPRLTLEKLRVAEALEGLPQLAQAARWKRQLVEPARAHAGCNARYGARLAPGVARAYGARGGKAGFGASTGRFTGWRQGLAGGAACHAF